MKAETEKAGRETLVSQLLSLGQEVVEMSEKTRDRQASRLEGVTSRENKSGETSAPGVPAETWPDLLCNLRSMFWQIRGNLKAMNDALDRLEI